MAPKPAPKGKAGTLPPEDDPAAQLPNDLPAESSFAVEWRPMVNMVWVADNLNAAAIREAMGKLKVAQLLSVSDLAARLDGSDPLAAEVAAAEGGNDSMPASTIAKLLQKRFTRDEGLCWKFEFVKRRSKLQQMQADAKAAEDALAAATAADSEAAAKLTALQTQLGLITPPAAEEAGEGEAAAGAAAALAGAVQHVQLGYSDEKRLNEARQHAEAAAAALAKAQQAMEVAAAALKDASDAMEVPHKHYEVYWVDGLPATVEGVQALIAEGTALRGAVWVHGPPQMAPSGTPARPSSAAAGAAAVPAATITAEPPPLFAALQAAAAAGVWKGPLGQLALLELAVGDPTALFTATPAAANAISCPPWAPPGSGPSPEAVAAAAAAAAPPSKGAKAAAAAAGAVEIPTEDLPGVREMGRALVTLRDRAAAYDEWLRSVKVHPLPAPDPDGCSVSGSSMGYYRNLLEGVPQERQSVPVLLHALVEQVARNCQGEDDVRQGEEAAALAAAEAAFDAAFRRFDKLTEQPLAGPAHDAPVRLAMVHEGDDLAAAAYGLFTGHVRPKPLPSPSPRSLLDSTAPFGSSSSNGSSSGGSPPHPQGTIDVAERISNFKGDSNFEEQSEFEGASGLLWGDVDGVETHMLSLLPLPGQEGAPAAVDDDGSAADAAAAVAGARGAMTEVERELRRTSLAAHCQDIAPGTVERYQLLRAFTGLLPEGPAVAHAASIMGRHHTEQLLPGVLRQALMKARSELTDMSSTYYAPLDATLLTCYAGTESAAASATMPHALSFRQHWQQVLEGGGAVTQLEPKVYEMGAREAQLGWHKRYLFTEAGATVCSSSGAGDGGGCLTVRKGGTTLKFTPAPQGSGHQALASLPGGATLLATSHPSEFAANASAAAASARASGTPASPAAVPAAAAPAGAPAAAATQPVGSRPASAASTAAPAASAVSGGLETVTEEGTEEGAGEQESGAQGAAGGSSPDAVASVQVVTPAGVLVEVTTEGRVLVSQAGDGSASEAKAPGAASCMGWLHASGLPGTSLAALLPPQAASAWRAVLPDGTLVRAAKPEHGGTMTLLHPDGTISEYQPGSDGANWASEHGISSSGSSSSSNAEQDGAPVPAAAGNDSSAAPAVAAEGGASGSSNGTSSCSSKTLAGWVRTTVDGERYYTAAPEAVAAAMKSLKDAADAAAAAEAAALAEAAAAALAAEAPPKKGSKAAAASKTRPPSASTAITRPATPPTAAEQAAAAVPVVAAPAAQPPVLELPSEVLYRQLPPMRAARLTDPDIGATAWTREDGLLVVRYLDGSCMLQDAEGCRMSRLADGSWCMEADGAPAVHGNGHEVTVEPCPGVRMAWSGLNRCITVTAPGGAAFTATPGARFAFSPPGTHQQQQQQQQDQQEVQEEGQQEQRQSGLVMFQDLAAPHRPAQPADEQQQEQEGQQEEQAAGEQFSVAQLPPLLPLADVCWQPECRGLFGCCLVTGAAAMYESELCHLELGPGGTAVQWVCEVPEPQEAVEVAAAAVAAADAAATAAAAAEAAAAAVAGEEDEEGQAKADAAKREADAAAAAAEEAAAVAAAKRTRPFAPGVKPRLFVVFPTGDGYEILEPVDFESYADATAAQPNCRTDSQPVLHGPEPGTVSHTFLTRCTPSNTPASLQPVPMAVAAAAVPYDPRAAATTVAMPSLRRPSIVEPSPPAQGLVMPWILAVAGGSSSGRSTGLQPKQSTHPPIVKVREVLQLPPLDDITLSKAQAAVAAWEAAEAGLRDELAAREAVADGRPENVREAEAKVAVALERALQLRAEKEAACAAALAAAQGEVDGAVEAARQQAEAAAARQAAEAAARMKPKKPWPKKEGPFDHTPKRPQPGSRLPYFAAEEGLIALQTQPVLAEGAPPITRHGLPPSKSPTPASPGAQARPGVYLAAHTHLADDPQPPRQTIAHGQHPLNSRATPSPPPRMRPGAIAPSPPSAASTLGGSLGTTPTGGSYAGPNDYRMTNAGRLSRSGAGSPNGISKLAAGAAGVPGGRVVGREDSPSGLMRGVSPGGESVGSVRSAATDVYGQPRATPPPLPPVYTQEEAARQLNELYLWREGPAMRPTKTSSTSLIRAHGKAGKQLALTPGHIHFGAVAAGSVVHRTARLHNVSPDKAKFHVVRPELPLRVLYKPCTIPAGMDILLTIELVAERPGDFVGEVTVKSEVNILTLSVSAKVVPADGNAAAGHLGGSYSALDAVEESPRVQSSISAEVGKGSLGRGAAGGSAGGTRPESGAAVGAVTERGPLLELDETKTLEELLASAQQQDQQAIGNAPSSLSGAS